jgi:RNA polymerase sigma-70 factor, ECF subfamily
MARARGPDPAARDALVRRHRPWLCRLLRRLTGDASLAEDLAQDTIISAMAHLDGWRGEGTVRGWLAAIARSRVLMQARSGSRFQFEDDRTLEQLGKEAGWGAAMDPEVLASRLDEQSVLERAMASLPAPSREVLVLRELEGLSGEEAAQVLGVSLVAMKSRLHRARLELVASVKKESAHE